MPSIADRIAALTGGGSGKDKPGSGKDKDAAPVATGREVRAGWVHKLGTMNTTQKRWCVVTTDPLLALYDKDSAIASSLKSSTSLQGASISKADSTFQFLPAGKPSAMKFKVESAAEADLWVAALHEACGTAAPAAAPAAASASAAAEKAAAEKAAAEKGKAAERAEADRAAADRKAAERKAEKKAEAEKAARIRSAVQDVHGCEGVPYCRCRLGLLGDGGMGKTATQRALTGQPFDRHIGSTVGAERHRCELDTRQLGVNADGGGGGCLLHEYKPEAAELEQALAAATAATLEGQAAAGGRTKLERVREQQSKREAEERPPEARRVAEATPEARTGRTTPAAAAPAPPPKAAPSATPPPKSPAPPPKAAPPPAVDEATQRKVMELLSSLTPLQVLKVLLLQDYGGQEMFDLLRHLLERASGNSVDLVVTSLVALQQSPTEALASLRRFLNALAVHAPSDAADEPPRNILIVGTCKDGVDGAASARCAS